MPMQKPCNVNWLDATAFDNEKACYSRSVSTERNCFRVGQMDAASDIDQAGPGILIRTENAGLSVCLGIYAKVKAGSAICQNPVTSFRSP